MEINKIYEGDALTVLKTFPSEVFNTCVTSPPYYGLRAYGTNPVIWDGDVNCLHEWVDSTYVRNNDKTAGEKQKTNVGAIGRDVPIKNDFCTKCGAWRGELGAEPTPELYVKHIVDIFREVKRVLKKDGTLWLNLGDSYWGGKGQSGQGDSERQAKRANNGESINQGYQQMGGKGMTRPADGKHPIIKPKDLIGIPWAVAFALRADGWWLRQDIIWSKRNPMPESVTDRCTKAHEYIFLLSKSAKYYYDAEAIKEDANYPNDDRKGRAKENHKSMPDGLRNGLRPGNYTYDMEKRNKRSVWEVNTTPYKEAHFATFPQELIVDCIKAGCPEGGLTLDPFVGSGTTLLVSRKLNRNGVGIELNPAYIKIANTRIFNEIGLFL